MSNYQRSLIKKFKAEGFIVLNVIKLSEAGYPDLILLKDGEATFVEVKEGRDTLKELQKYRIDELKKQGFNAYCCHKTKGIIYGK